LLDAPAVEPHPDRRVIRCRADEQPSAEEVRALEAQGFELRAICRVGYSSMQLDYHYELPPEPYARTRQDAADGRKAVDVQPDRADRSGEP
jgi:hypothetical protein